MHFRHRYSVSYLCSFLKEDEAHSEYEHAREARSQNESSTAAGLNQTVRSLIISVSFYPICGHRIYIYIYIERERERERERVHVESNSCIIQEKTRINIRLSSFRRSWTVFSVDRRRSSYH